MVNVVSKNMVKSQKAETAIGGGALVAMELADQGFYVQAYYTLRGIIESVEMMFDASGQEWPWFKELEEELGEWPDGQFPSDKVHDALNMEAFLIEALYRGELAPVPVPHKKLSKRYKTHLLDALQAVADVGLLN